jgi:hypothetical protein
MTDFKKYHITATSFFVVLTSAFARAILVGFLISVASQPQDLRTP